MEKTYPHLSTQVKQNSFQFVDTTATQKIFSLRKRIRAVAGGTSASKTISILVWLIDYSQSRRNKVSSVVSESFPHLSKGAMRDFENIMKDRGYWNDSRWNSTSKTYTFETDSILEFTSMDSYGKAHGSRRDILFINECNFLDYLIADQLITRTREIVWLDWNPSSEFWFYTEMLNRRDDIDFITLTYKDNEALDESTIREIESHINNKRWWQVYGLGQLGEVEGLIYSGWQIIDEIPHEARLERYGLDFGYTNDPTASDAIYKWNGAFIIDEVIHQKGMSNKQIADVYLNLPRALIIADSAEPKSIDEIKSYGLTIIPSQKGQGSVLQGIQYVQDQKIFVTRRSLNTIKEQRNYMWITDKDGKIINEPSPIWNHHMDACFVADTKITTNKGLVNIKDISIGDLVLTSSGYKPVVLKHDNGLKLTKEYRLQSDTIDVIVRCTPDHKVKTNKGWTKISQLKSGMMVYLTKSLMERSINSIQEKSISHKVNIKCIFEFGSLVMGVLQKASTFTTSMRIVGIILLRILRSLSHISIYQNTLKKELKKTQSGTKSFKERELKKLQSGTNQKKELTGIQNMEKKHGLIGSIKYLLVRFVKKNIRQHSQIEANIVIKTVRLKHLGVGESKKERVFDLTIQDKHEYFANGLLVHNCRYGMDSFRNTVQWKPSEVGGVAPYIEGTLA